MLKLSFSTLIKLIGRLKTFSFNFSYRLNTCRRNLLWVLFNSKTFRPITFPRFLNLPANSQVVGDAPVPAPVCADFSELFPAESAGAAPPNSNPCAPSPLDALPTGTGNNRKHVVNKTDKPLLSLHAEVTELTFMCESSSFKLLFSASRAVSSCWLWVRCCSHSRERWWYSCRERGAWLYLTYPADGSNPMAWLGWYQGSPSGGLSLSLLR